MKLKLLFAIGLVLKFKRSGSDRKYYGPRTDGPYADVSRGRHQPHHAGGQL